MSGLLSFQVSLGFPREADWVREFRNREKTILLQLNRRISGEDGGTFKKLMGQIETFPGGLPLERQAHLKHGAARV